MPYIIAFVIVGVFIAVVMILATKENKEINEQVSKLTEEQKFLLTSADVVFVKENVWVQKAMVANIKEKGNKAEVRLLWFNTVITNNCYNTIRAADTTITKAEQEEHNLKYGDYVKMYLDPKKPEIKIIWD